ncbi:MAG: lanthionine synthetase C family protein, partial [Kofleriaceae bacterium]
PHLPPSPPMIDPRPILTEIDHALARWLAGSVRPGLLDGACGAALFYAYYAALTERDEHVDRVHSIVEDALAALGSGALAPAHCGGIAGIAWCLHHLDERGFVDTSGDTLAAIDERLCRAVVRDVRAGARDFLHDGLGAVLYLGERAASPAIHACLVATIAELERTATHDDRGTRWIDERTGTFNLGLAHGNPGILALVAHLHRAGVDRTRTGALLADGVRWLRSSRFAEPGAGSRYPIAVDASGAPTHHNASRLGWCYGDLGIAVALLDAGTALADAALVAEAVSLLHHTLAHRSADDGQVHDAALCHGSMGIAQIYRRAYLVTADPALLAGSERWIEHGIALARFPDGPAGFKHSMAHGYEPSHTLLQGVAGIGLALLAAIGPPSESAWDRSLLLS